MMEVGEFEIRTALPEDMEKLIIYTKYIMGAPYLLTTKLNIKMKL